MCSYRYIPPLLSLLLLPISKFALAQPITHMYFGASFIKSNSEVMNASRSGPFAGGTAHINTMADDAGKGWKLFGGYQFHQHFAVEAAYFDLGTFGQSGTRNINDASIFIGPDREQTTISTTGTLATQVSPRGFSITGLAIWQVHNKISLKAHLGANFYSYSTDTSFVDNIPAFTFNGEEFAERTINSNRKEDHSTIGLAAGLRMDYRINLDWSAGLTWQRYTNVDMGFLSGKNDFDTTQLHIIYHY